MKVAVTGHTKGVGKGIYDLLTEMDYEVSGLSRSNGFDLDNQQTYFDQFAKYGKQDVVVNNAYSGIGQSNLLLFLRTYYPDAYVINIGSVSADRTDARTDSQIQYASDKAHLRATHEHALRSGYKSTLIELGMCDTEYNQSKPGPKLSTEYVAAVIEDLIQADMVHIPKFTLLAKDTDGN